MSNLPSREPEKAVERLQGPFPSADTMIRYGMAMPDSEESLRPSEVHTTANSFRQPTDFEPAPDEELAAKMAQGHFHVPPAVPVMLPIEYFLRQSTFLHGSGWYDNSWYATEKNGAITFREPIGPLAPLQYWTTPTTSPPPPGTMAVFLEDMP